ncbi:MAG: rhomboid family intramembrane serine protease, partial [Candidatus Omnitrophica bacterium]|nr:rhomboid family intramembrane serine protease [Candidatus Omnitrophota bacterium]
ASLGFIMLVPNSKLPLIGASGAISGVLGAYFLSSPEAKIQVLLPLFIFWKKIRIQAFWFLLFWILYQFFYGTATFDLKESAKSGGISWIAHVIGFISGAFFLTIFSRKTTPEGSA